MFRRLAAKFTPVSRAGDRPSRVPILVAFLIISAALGVLAWRSYELSVRMERGANTLAVQYAGYAAEITARRIDARVREVLTQAVDDWQQIERGIEAPTNSSLREWMGKKEWIVTAIYIPDFDPASSIYASYLGAAENVELIEAYERFLISGIPPAALKGKKVVLDTGHGAAYRIAPEVFRRAGADVVVIHDAPNGRNINEGAGALHPERLAEVVVQQQADYGVAFDGDADRAIFADDAGRIRDGDEIIYLWAMHLHRRGELRGPCVVTTVMSNFGFEKQLQADGIELCRAQVGDKYVLEQMLQRDAILGGEQSGHIIDRTVHTTGDGIHTAFVFGHILAEIGKPFSELRTFDPMPQLLLNEKVGAKPALESLAKYQAAHAKAMEELNGRGRILVRYSGTENLVRVMVEGEDATLIRRIAEDLRSVLKEEIG